MHDATNRQTGDHAWRTKAKSNGNVSLPSGRKESLKINYARAHVACRVDIRFSPYSLRRLRLSLVWLIYSCSLRAHWFSFININVLDCIFSFLSRILIAFRICNGDNTSVHSFLITPRTFETGLKHLRICEQLAFNKLNYLVAWHRSSCRE